MPHLNKLKKEYEDKGLSVLAVTSAGASETEAWIKDTKAGYGYAYDKRSELSRAWNITGIPHAVLVTPDGLVAWRGHPNSLTDTLIDKAVETALKKPVWNWPASAKAVKAALKKNQFAKAISLARTGALKNQDEELDAIGNALATMVKGKIAATQETYEKGDYLGAWTMASALSKDLKGLPEEAEAKEIVAKIKADKEAQKVIKAQKKLAKVVKSLEKAKRKKHFQRAIASAKAAVKGLEGTFANQEAEELIAQLEKSMERAP